MLQVIPAYRLPHLQARLVAVESIHQRIKRLRETKGLSQEALAKLVGVKYQSVQEWERENGTAPSRKRQPKVASALGVSVPELMTGGVAVAVEEAARDAREEILLHLYRGLIPLQQARLIQSLRALFDANQVARRQLGEKPLRGVNDHEVRAAFGDAPFHTLKRKAKKTGASKRDLGDAMGDFLDD